MYPQALSFTYANNDVLFDPDGFRKTLNVISSHFHDSASGFLVVGRRTNVELSDELLRKINPSAFGAGKMTQVSHITQRRRLHLQNAEAAGSDLLTINARKVEEDKKTESQAPAMRPVTVGRHKLKLGSSLYNDAAISWSAIVMQLHVFTSTPYCPRSTRGGGTVGATINLVVPCCFCSGGVFLLTHTI